jgi:hypothetical protein
MTISPERNCGKCKFFRGAPNMQSSKAWCLWFVIVVSRAYNDPDNRAPSCANYVASDKYQAEN